MAFFYRPWWRDRIRAGASIVLAGVSGTIGAMCAWISLTRFFPWREMVGLAALTCLIAAWALKRHAAACWRSADRRQHGAVVETDAIRLARPALRQAGWAVKRNVRLSGSREDVDLVARKRRVLIPIEIKSYERWGQSSREMQALAQVGRQVLALDARLAVIWLPKARHRPPTRITTEVAVILIVPGNTQSLVSALGSLA